jgi:hypothetical protein
MNNGKEAVGVETGIRKRRRGPVPCWWEARTPSGLGVDLRWIRVGLFVHHQVRTVQPLTR